MDNFETRKFSSFKISREHTKFDVKYPTQILDNQNCIYACFTYEYIR